MENNPRRQHLQDSNVIRAVDEEEDIWSVGMMGVPRPPPVTPGRYYVHVHVPVYLLVTPKLSPAPDKTCP